MEYKTERELIEKAYYGKDGRTGGPIRLSRDSTIFVTPFGIAFYEKTKRDSDFDVIWDSTWKKQPKDYSPNSPWLEQKKSSFNYVYGLRYGGNSICECNHTHNDYADTVKKFTEEEPFPWEYYIEKVRKKLKKYNKKPRKKNNQGGA